jgi:hypothetical protein
MEAGTVAAIASALWESGWSGHEFEQLKRLARLPFSEKLKWLEEAHRFVRAVEAERGKSIQKTSGLDKQK